MSEVKSNDKHVDSPGHGRFDEEELISDTGASRVAFRSCNKIILILGYINKSLNPGQHSL